MIVRDLDLEADVIDYDVVVQANAIGEGEARVFVGKKGAGTQRVCCAHREAALLQVESAVKCAGLRQRERPLAGFEKSTEPCDVSIKGHAAVVHTNPESGIRADIDGSSPGQMADGFVFSNTQCREPRNMNFRHVVDGARTWLGGPDYEVAFLDQHPARAKVLALQSEPAPADLAYVGITADVATQRAAYYDRCAEVNGL
ncbi:MULTISPECIES: hypothetical protein [Phyllobacteriaceae]|uniref:hypothetical protein n=1 Tax=Mesorhizobium TaxID=68287 RepID=UPI0013778CF5|nr:MULTISPECIES: hypothetical protein [Mesorhizobium]MBN9234414.1 hypothetical protein [Mesorhizobium sp.]MDQ0332479.1 hypothetical protein [Mesorhizobium sp. YL-MeA3-2017]